MAGAETKRRLQIESNATINGLTKKKEQVRGEGMNRSDEISLSDAERLAWEQEFAAAAQRPLEVRLRYAFVRTYKPVLDDVAYRSFEQMADYREWCATQLPSWLGYGRV